MNWLTEVPRKAKTKQSNVLVWEYEGDHHIFCLTRTGSLELFFTRVQTAIVSKPKRDGLTI